jgi:hypothetical protein
MKSNYLLFLGMMLVLCACKWGDGDTSKPKPDITTDTLTYAYKTIKERAADCGDKPDSGCTVVKINYPIFKNQDTLNRIVSNKLVNLFGADEPGLDCKNMRSISLHLIPHLKNAIKDLSCFSRLIATQKF